MLRCYCFSPDGKRFPCCPKAVKIPLLPDCSLCGPIDSQWMRRGMGSFPPTWYISMEYDLGLIIWPSIMCGSSPHTYGVECASPSVAGVSSPSHQPRTGPRWLWNSLQPKALHSNQLPRRAQSPSAHEGERDCEKEKYCSGVAGWIKVSNGSSRSQQCSASLRRRNWKNTKCVHLEVFRTVFLADLK